jgi:hypothetical protein
MSIALVVAAERLLERPWLALAGVAGLSLLAWNMVGLGQTALWLLRQGAAAGDWVVFWGVTVDDPYAVGGFHWAPPAAWLLVWLVQPLGLTLWQLLHIPVLALIRDWRIVLVGLCTWAFWQDFANGNILTFVVVAAWWALRGNSAGTIAFIAIAVLVPRPLMIPVLLTLLWRHRWARIWFAAALLAVVAFSASVGLLDDWLLRLFAAKDELFVIWNIAPSRIMGALWIPITLVLSVALWRARWFGLASIAASPYLFPYYLLFALLDVPLAVKKLDGLDVRGALRDWRARRGELAASTRT